MNTISWGLNQYNAHTHNIEEKAQYGYVFISWRSNAFIGLQSERKKRRDQASVERKITQLQLQFMSTSTLKVSGVIRRKKKKKKGYFHSDSVL